MHVICLTDIVHYSENDSLQNQDEGRVLPEQVLQGLEPRLHGRLQQVEQFAIYLVLGIFEQFQHEKNGKFLELVQTFRKSLSICGRVGNQVFM